MIRSADRDVIRRQAVLQRIDGGRLSFSCPKGCGFYRVYTTAAGAVNGAAAHLAGEHRVRLTLGKAS